MPVTWINALKDWNSVQPFKTEAWAIPRKDSPGYKAVKGMMKGESPVVIKDMPEERLASFVPQGRRPLTLPKLNKK